MTMQTYLLPVLTAPVIHLTNSLSSLFIHKWFHVAEISVLVVLFFFLFSYQFIYLWKVETWGRDGDILTRTGSYVKRNYSSNSVSEMTGPPQAKQVDCQTVDCKVDIVDTVLLTGWFCCLSCCAVISHQQDFQVVPLCIGVFEGETGFQTEKTCFWGQN